MYESGNPRLMRKAVRMGYAISVEAPKPAKKKPAKKAAKKSVKKANKKE